MRTTQTTVLWRACRPRPPCPANYANHCPLEGVSSPTAARCELRKPLSSGDRHDYPRASWEVPETIHRVVVGLRHPLCYWPFGNVGDGTDWTIPKGQEATVMGLLDHCHAVPSWGSWVHGGRYHTAFSYSMPALSGSTSSTMEALAVLPLLCCRFRRGIGVQKTRRGKPTRKWRGTLVNSRP